MVQCRLPPSQPSTNVELLTETERLEQAWHDCAAQVDMIKRCQDRADQEATSTKPS